MQIIDRYYHRLTSESNEGSQELKFIFYSRSLDSIHHWLYHMFASAMRIKSSDITQNKKQKDDEQDKEHIDE